MEAFILTDKVIAREHMTRQSVKPKYLKRYEVSPTTPKNRIQTVVPRKILTPIVSVNAPRTKDLLVELIHSKKEINFNSPTNEKIDKYFTMAS